MTRGLNRRGRVSKCLRKSHSRQSVVVLLRTIRLVTHKQSVLLLRFAFVAAWFGKLVKTGATDSTTDRQVLYAKMTEGCLMSLPPPSSSNRLPPPLSMTEGWDISV